MPSKTPDAHLVLPSSCFDRPWYLTDHFLTSSETVSIRILLLSDTHRLAPFPADSPRPYRDPLPDADILIHAGDLTDTGRYEEHVTTFNVIASHPAPIKIVIPGNHDLSLDTDYFVTRKQTPFGISAPNGKIPQDQFWQQCIDLWTSSEARRKGLLLCFHEGVQEVQIKGAALKIYTTPYTPSFGNWAFGYSRPPEGLDRFNVSMSDSPSSRIPDDVDIIVSHGPPLGVLDKVLAQKPFSVGCESLLAAVRRVKPLLHVFGHIHEGYGVQRVDWFKENGQGGGPMWKAGNTDMDDVVPHNDRVGVNWIDLRKHEKSMDSEERGLEMVIDGPELKHGQETLFVNAAIMTRFGQARHSPWVVDLDIPVRKGDGAFFGNELGATL